MADAAAQITAPESVPQTDPVCDHCGSKIALGPTERDCCHRMTADIHALQLDSSRQSGRYVIYLRKLIERLDERILELETRPRKGKA